MDPDCGAPAFDNIDEVLANRIIDHGRNHSDRTETASAADGKPLSTPEDTPDAPYGISLRYLIAGSAIFVGLLLLLYRLTRRSSRR